MRYFRLFVFFVAVWGLVSCTKDNPDKDDGPLTAAQLVENVRGKWLFASGALEIEALTPRSRETGLKSMVSPARRLGAPLATMGVATYAAEANTAFIEFLDDNTYLIYDGNGGVAAGTFEATSGASLVLSNFGTISDIKFNQEKIDFKITYSATNQTMTIVANKAEQIPLDSRTSLLCRTWLLSRDEDGAEVYEDGVAVYDDDYNIIEEIEIDKATITMSSAGTYIVKLYSKGELVEADMANWKWHSTDDNRFVYWWDDYEFDEDEDFVEIRELTRNVLKILEYWYDADGDRIEIKYTFTPVGG